MILMEFWKLRETKKKKEKEGGWRAVWAELSMAGHGVHGMAWYGA